MLGYLKDLLKARSDLTHHTFTWFAAYGRGQEELQEDHTHLPSRVCHGRDARTR